MPTQPRKPRKAKPTTWARIKKQVTYERVMLFVGLLVQIVHDLIKKG